MFTVRWAVLMTNSPNERRKSKTRQEIIQTAHRMIVQQGLDNLSIRALAEQIDYSPAALYRYFGSKDELIDVVRERCFEQLNAAIFGRIQHLPTAAEQLYEGGLAYIDYAGEHPADYHLMFLMEPSEITRTDYRDRTMQALLHIVQNGIQAGDITPRDDYPARTIAYHCWATVHGLAMLQTGVLRDEREELQAMSRQILRRVIAGVA